MGKYDETYREIFKVPIPGVSKADELKCFWMYKIANELAERNRLERQAQCMGDEEFITADENVDKA